jgi:hypothetical protein
MKPNSAGMVFFEDEYSFLERNGLLQEGFKKQSRFWEFPFSKGLSLNFVTSVCSLEGKCTIPKYRPLICKLYPYLPRINFETLEVVGHVNASVVDQFWSSLKIQEPCTLAREKSDIIKQQMQPAVEVLLEYPYLLFYIKATELFLDMISEHFRIYRESHPDWSVAELISKWELQYLAGRSFDKSQLRLQLEKQYLALKERFRTFELATP